MSRSGYVEGDEYEWPCIRYRGTVTRAIQGRRGQSALLEMCKALDAMPEKKLARSVFNAECGQCALGVLAESRGVDLGDLEPRTSDDDPEYVDEVDTKALGQRLDIAPSMAAEVMWANDDSYDNSEAGQRHRWRWVRDWAERQLTPSNREALNNA